MIAPSRSVLAPRRGGHLVVAVLACSALAACDSGGGKSGAGGKTQKTAEAPAAKGEGVIEGTVKLVGDPPAAKEWGGSGFSGCAGKHPATIQLVKADGGKLQDAFVYVKAGLPPGSHEAPSAPVVVDQKACEFTPRVFGAMSEQPIQWGNSDPMMHNVNSGQFNQGLAAAGVTFTKPSSGGTGASPMIHHSLRRPPLDARLRGRHEPPVLPGHQGRRRLPPRRTRGRRVHGRGLARDAARTRAKGQRKSRRAHEARLRR